MGRKAPVKKDEPAKDDATEGDCPLILIPTAIETLPTTEERVRATLARAHN